MTREELKQKTVSAISLGCDKNRVDLEHMLFCLSEYGFRISADIEEAEIVIVNTCAFLESAMEEAIENILEATSLKLAGKVEKVIVSGCLPMRDKTVEDLLPEVDAFITLSDNPNIVGVIEKLYGLEQSGFKADPAGRVITHQGGYAYLKISEGCSNGCAYCTIPRIRGRFRSVPEKEVLAEANALVRKGYKELILVAQDTARYGEDIDGHPNLVGLLEKLVKIKGLEWIKLQYIYPEWVSVDLLAFIANEDKMCKYIDMPLQHIDDEILKRMNRKTDEDETRKLVKMIKTMFPDIVLRSTFIVGFPGETRAQFKKLCDFIRDGNITYASFFAFSKEQNTPAFYMPRQISAWVKKRRLKQIEKVQNFVMNNININRIGQEVEVRIDGFDSEAGMFYGHERDASPEVDLKVFLEFEENCQMPVGAKVNVRLCEMTEQGFKGERV